MGDITPARRIPGCGAREAEAIYEQGREVVIAVLLRMDEQIQRLSAQVAEQGERILKQEERIVGLERRLNRSSRNSSAAPEL